MEEPKQAKKVPWASFGRKTPISELARSVLPAGNFPRRLPPKEHAIIAKLGDSDYENYLMDIQGAAFQAGRGKLLTCWHVCESLQVKQGGSLTFNLQRKRMERFSNAIGLLLES